jgi:hypothetical protein
MLAHHVLHQHLCYTNSDADKKSSSFLDLCAVAVPNGFTSGGVAIVAASRL